MKPGNELLFCALGGSGEIGMNVNLYGAEGRWLMVDMGVTFADHSYPGIDLVLPDLQFIEDRADDLAGIVLTHGHEDHIGALAYLAEDLDVPLYATRFTAGLIRGKLEEERIADRVKLRIVDPWKCQRIGPFAVEFVPMAHSIPEAHALVIEAAGTRVFHSGDWKLDPAPVLGNPATPEQLTAIGDRGVDVLVCDSTNVFNAEPSGSEADVRVGLAETIARARGRVLVTTFASNAARLHTLGEIAQETGRKLCVAGRSLDRIIRVSQATGYLRDLPPPIDADTAMRLPRDKVLVVATGGQGEVRAALSRIAERSHPIALAEGDTAIFSSKQIPGNEVAIGRIQNLLAGQGVEMVTEKQAHVHVSGHPGRPELAQLYRWLRPRLVVPVHGEMRHLREHARFAKAEGIAEAIVQTDGAIVRLAPGPAERIGTAPVGRLVLDGDVILPADGAAINERRKLALNGQISVAVAIGRQGRPAGEPEIRLQGIPVEEDRAAFLADAIEAAGAAARERTNDKERRREAIRLAVRRVATRWTGKKPIVDVLLVEV